MKTDSVAFQLWQQNIKIGGYVAAGALVSLGLSLWLTAYGIRLAVASVFCGLLSFLLTVVQLRTKFYFGYLHTMFSVFSMLFVTHLLAPPEHRGAALWQFASIYTTVWFGLIFLFRRSLKHRLELTHAKA